ncbi:MAG: molybdenum cofactor guanylyltransferase [Proteobacteria bacterium]|nr:molybdenum cofactor guanylyltransferase [Pseudomonadota bacterium]
MPSKVISGVVLAGGLGSRLGGEDKGLVEIDHVPMVKLVLERFAPQVDPIVINANRNLARYEAFGYPVVTDENNDFEGPLAGIAAALGWCSTPYLATAPCDTPFLPRDFVVRLFEALRKSEAQIAVAFAGDRPQPAFTVIAVTLKPALTKFLAQGGRKISTWYRQQSYVEVDFGADVAPFANINTEDDLAVAVQRQIKFRD